MHKGQVFLIRICACVALLCPFLWIIYSKEMSRSTSTTNPTREVLQVTPRVTTLDPNSLRGSPVQNKIAIPTDPVSHSLEQLIMHQAPTKRLITPSAPLDTRPTMLLSSNCLVTASTLGNLAPPHVVVDPRMESWLTDRWQAAQDLTGKAIPGPHWIELTFNHPVQEISDMIIDYETAFANDYAVEVCFDGSEVNMIVGCKEWKQILRSSQVKQRIKVTNTPQHVVHHVDVTYYSDKAIRKLRLYIFRPATKWGTSIWRLEVWGRYTM